MLAYFGYPQAHEDDAERAVRAGLAQIEASATWKHSHSLVRDTAYSTLLRGQVGRRTREPGSKYWGIPPDARLLLKFHHERGR